MAIKKKMKIKCGFKIEYHKEIKRNKLDLYV